MCWQPRGLVVPGNILQTLSEIGQVDFSAAPALLLWLVSPKIRCNEVRGDLGGFASVSVKLYVIPNHYSRNFKDDDYITLLNWCFNDVFFEDIHNGMSASENVPLQWSIYLPRWFLLHHRFFAFQHPSPSSALAIPSAALLTGVLLPVLIWAEAPSRIRGCSSTKR